MMAVAVIDIGVL